MEQQSFIDGYSFNPESSPKESRKLKTMIQLHGAGPEGKTCKTCSHLMPCDYHCKRYYKCELWEMSHSKATDIRLKQQACSQYDDVPEKSQKRRWIG